MSADGTGDGASPDRRAILVLGAIAVLLLAGVGVYLVVGSDSGGEDAAGTDGPVEGATFGRFRALSGPELVDRTDWTVADAGLPGAHGNGDIGCRVDTAAPENGVWTADCSLGLSGDPDGQVVLDLGLHRTADAAAETYDTAEDLLYNDSVYDLPEQAGGEGWEGKVGRRTIVFPEQDDTGYRYSVEARLIGRADTMSVSADLTFLGGGESTVEAAERAAAGVLTRMWEHVQTAMAAD